MYRKFFSLLTYNNNPVLKQKIMKRHCIILFVSFTACFLSGCDKADDSDSPYLGVWLREAYGEVLVIDDESSAFYDITEDTCILRLVSEIGAANTSAQNGWILNEAETQLRNEVDILGIHYVNFSDYIRVDKLPDVCMENFVDRVGDKQYERDLVRDFSIFWKTFDEYYLSFDLKNVDWQEIFIEYRNQITPNMTDDQFFVMLGEIIQHLSDQHAVVIKGLQDGKPTASTTVISSNNTKHQRLLDVLWQEFNERSEEDDAQMFEQYVQDAISKIMTIKQSYAAIDSSIKTGANNKVEWFTTQDNMGLLSIYAMDEFVIDEVLEDPTLSLIEKNFTVPLSALEETINEALSDLSNTQGLIIDVRGNPGGSDAASQIIAKHFMDTERHVYSKQARFGADRTSLEHVYLAPSGTTYYQPVVILTSTDTVSAAETFVLMMRELPNVTVIGSNTQGALSDALLKVLPNDIYYTLSNEFVFSPSGNWFEDVGIPVDIEVQYGTLEQRNAGIDSGIDEAISHIKSMSSSL